MRIAPGLVVGESDSGALALNDPEPANQWIEFVVSDTGEPWATIITREKSLRVDGATRMRHQLGVGTVVQLPNNTLHVSRDTRMPAHAGQVIEVVSREVPGRPQDLVAPGWAEALAAVREPQDASGALEPGEPLEAEAPTQVLGSGDDTEREWGAAPPPDPELDEITRVAEPRPRMQPDQRRLARRPRWGRRAAVMLLALGVGTVTIGGIVAVLLAAGSGSSQRPADVETSRLEPDLRIPPDAPPGQNPAASSDPPALSSPVGRQGGRPFEPEDEALAGSPAADAPVVEPGEQPVTESAPPPPLAEDRPPADERADEWAPVQEPALEEDVTEPVERAAGEVAPADTATSSPPAEVASSKVPLRSPSEDTVERDTPVEEGVRQDPPLASSAPPDWRLVRARELLDAGYVTYPPRDNAVAYLERLLADQPNHPGALALLERCSNELIDASLRAHDQGLEYEARNTLEEVLGFDPNNPQANRLWREWVDAAR